MRWYADNSELKGLRGALIPDILLFGGVAVLPEHVDELRYTIESVKATYGPGRAPVKWNFKDLENLYIRQGMHDIYHDLLPRSKAWRKDVFEAVSEIPFTVIISCVQSHSVDRKIIKGLKPDLTKYVFSNGLMRFALHILETKPDRCQVILDWPDKGDPRPFDSEYYWAYNKGTTIGTAVPYYSGPLKKLGFTDSVVFSNMNHSTLLQFANLVLGATSEVVECAIENKSPGFGLDMAKVISSKYRGYRENIFGRGISVASGDSAFRIKVRDFINRELF